MSMAAMFDYMLSLMTANAPMFQSLGMSLFRGFAIILIAWFGIKTALASASGGEGFRIDHFAELVLHISFGLAMLQFYAAPIPGMGVSFYQLFTKMGEHLSTSISNADTDALIRRISSIYLGIETPTLSIAINLLEFARFFIIWVLVLCAEGLAWGIIGLGYVASAIGILLGPVFIPFFIVPGMEWLFWGWFKYLIQFSFYPVVATAYLYVFGQMLIRFTDGHPPPYDGAAIAVLFGPLFILLISFIYGILKIPSLTNALFTGRSGESARPRSLF